ncbi:PWWP domain protein, partial [Trifolium medium]|nr:PWWP domain protein [Trifolium medium]
MFETESKEQFGVSSGLAENVMVEDGSEKEKNENGVGEKGLCDDGVVVEVVKSSVFETEVVSVLKENDSQVVADSEVNNGSVVCEKVDCEG